MGIGEIVVNVFCLGTSLIGKSLFWGTLPSFFKGKKDKHLEL